MIPILGSPAIDAADNTICPATDYRTVTRPVDGDNNGTAVCDMGAYEWTDSPHPEPTPPPPDTERKLYVPVVLRAGASESSWK